MKTITKETKNKISKTKSDTGRQAVLQAASTCKAKASNTKLAIPSHRTKKRISLEEYQNLLKQGKTTLEVCKITSKQLVYFYNALLKGRITLSKEKFIEMYDQGMSLDEIAKESNTTRENIGQLREFYGIKRKGATYQKRLNNEQPLSQEAKNIIIGSLLGDGHITKWGYFSEKHSPAQLEYLQWKASFFPNITTDKSWDTYECLSEIGSWEGITKSHCYRTTVHSWIQEMEKVWYKNIDGKRIKIVPNQIDEWMNIQILAVWFMDDGITDWNQRKKNQYNANPTSIFCTDSFSNEDIKLLKSVLSEKFGLQATPSNNRNRLTLTTTSTLTLHKIVKPYIHQELEYKIDVRKYAKKTT